MTIETERRRDAERLGRVESDVVWIKEIIGKAADDLTEIKIILAQQKGFRGAVAYITHSLVGIAGVILTYFGVKH